MSSWRVQTETEFRSTQMSIRVILNLCSIFPPHLRDSAELVLLLVPGTLVSTENIVIIAMVYEIAVTGVKLQTHKGTTEDAEGSLVSLKPVCYNKKKNLVSEEYRRLLKSQFLPDQWVVGSVFMSPFHIASACLEPRQKWYQKSTRCQVLFTTFARWKTGGKRWVESSWYYAVEKR